MAWTERTTAPSVADVYYRGVGYDYLGVDGVNECIVIDSNTGFVMPNCVGYTWGRWYEAFGRRPTLSTGNAVGWYAYTVDGYGRSLTDPEIGAIACFAGGGYGGHVAVIERITYDGNNDPQYLYTSNSAYNDTLFWWEILSKDPDTQVWTRPVTGYTFQGFILPPANKMNPFILGMMHRRFPNGKRRIMDLRRS